MLENKIIVSIVIPVYNASQTLHTCLDSCICQNYNNYEVICVDDGSSDDSATVLNEYAEQHPGVIKIYRQVNKGVVEARDLGVEVSHGDYLFFLDADDTIPTDILKKMADIAHSTQADIIIGDIEHVDTERTHIMHYAHNVESGKQLFDWIIKNRVGFLWGKLIKKSLFQSIQVKPVGLLFCEDFAQMLQISALAGKVVHVGVFSYSYIQHEESYCNKKKTRSEYANMFYKLSNVLRKIWSLDLYEEEEVKSLQILFLYYLRLYIWVRGTWKYDEENLRNHWESLLCNSEIKTFLKENNKKLFLQLRLTQHILPFISYYYNYLLRYKFERII